MTVQQAECVVRKAYGKHTQNTHRILQWLAGCMTRPRPTLLALQLALVCTLAAFVSASVLYIMLFVLSVSVLCAEAQM